MKTHINTALEPLLQRITALEAENQEIRAILKNIPQAKPAPPGKTVPPNNTTSNKNLNQVRKKFHLLQKLMRHKRNIQTKNKTIRHRKPNKKKNLIMGSILKVKNMLKANQKYKKPQPSLRNVDVMLSRTRK